MESKTYEQLCNNLEIICNSFTDTYENLLGNSTIGTCYLIGHCLAEGFKKAGLVAREVTGTAIYKDKNEKNVIYGKSIVKGSNVGIYHTWCELQIDNQIIIVDPSYKYNKIWIRDIHNLKLNRKIPDIIITNKSSQWLHTFIEDSTLKQLSKLSLSQISPVIIETLIDEVKRFSTQSTERNQNLG